MRRDLGKLPVPGGSIPAVLLCPAGSRSPCRGSKSDPPLGGELGINRPMVVFPLPLSPMSDRMVPGRISKDTSCTAVVYWRKKTPLLKTSEVFYPDDGSGFQTTPSPMSR